MCEIIQRAKFQVGQHNAWIIARRREHWKGLHVDIGNFHLARASVTVNRVRKSMDDEVGIFACIRALLKHIRADFERVSKSLAQHFENIVAGIVDAKNRGTGVAQQRDKWNAISFDKILEATRRGKLD